MNALQQCQWRHDNAEPPVPWIETLAGQEWLRSNTASLILGLDVHVSFKPRLVVESAEFISQFSERAQHLMSADFKLEWALARGNPFAGGAEYQRLAREVAEEMLLPHCDAAEEARNWRHAP